MTQENPPDAPRESVLKRSRFGIISVIIALLSAILLVPFVIPAQLGLESVSIDDSILSPVVSLILMLACAMQIFPLIGVTISLIGLVADRRKIFAIVGFATNISLLMVVLFWAVKGD